MNHIFRVFIVSLTLAWFGAASTLAYTVYFKDGTSVNAQKKYSIKGSEALILLRNGTTASYPASQIDVARTDRANTNNLGSAMVLEGGKVVEAERKPTPKSRKTLSDAIASGEASIRQRAEVRRQQDEVESPNPARQHGYFSSERAPYRNLEVASEIQQQYEVKGIGEVQVFQGSQPNRVLLDVKTNSEASVFLSLEVAAKTLLQLEQLHPGDVGAFELLMTTEAGQLGGQFEITQELAEVLNSGSLKTSSFFIDHVRF